MRRAVIYLRVSTVDQTTANQERELREIADHMGCKIVKVYKDHGISGAEGRDKRPAFDKMCRDAARREFDLVMAWSVDSLHSQRSNKMVKIPSSRPLRWRGAKLGGKLQRGAKFCLYRPEIEAKTHELSAWMRPDTDKPARWQIIEHARALRSIGAQRLRREGREWIWRLPELSKK